MPRVLRFLYKVTVLSTWHHAGLGGIPAEPEMPYLRRIPIRRRWAFLAGGIAVIAFVAAHFAELKWLRIVLFAAVFFVVVFWIATAAIGAARLFLRVDRRLSTSYPLDWPWH
jgi:hypothetical protein